MRGERSNLSATAADSSLALALKHVQTSGCSIVVIGRKHAGKSTLVNEILGTPILLTELPEDSTRYITRIRNSESYRLRLLAKDETVLDEKTFASSGHLRDEYRNNVRYRREKIHYIDILLPIPGFKGNFMIIDTQHCYQVGELVDILANSPPVYAFVIVVDGPSWDCTASKHDTAFNALLESITKSKLQATQHESTQTMFVVNKLDLMAEKEKSQEAEEKRCAMKREIMNTWEYIEEKNIFHLSAKHPQSGRISKAEFGKFRNTLSRHAHITDAVPVTQTPGQSFMPMDDIEERLVQEYQALKKDIQMHETDMKENLFARKKWRRGMDIEALFKNQLSDLKRKECSIVVVGETSAGKTTLINRILQQDVFTPHNLAATATVTRIRHSSTPQIKIYTKEERLMQDFSVELSEMKQKLDECTDCSKIPESLQDAYYVDVFLPIPDFQGNVYLVDTPGIGTNSHLNEVLFDFLPNAGSFIFVIDATAADNPSRNNFLGLIRKIAESSPEMPCFNPESVVFLTNKWDLIRTDKEKKVISARLEKRLFKEWHTMSSKNLFKVSLKEVNEQKTTPNTIEYREFEDRLKETITAYQNKRMHTHTRFLDQLTKDLCHVFDSGIESGVDILNTMKESLNRLKSIRVYCLTVKDRPHAFKNS
ncbi:uncharacterized protein LOC125662212 isoform X4 [Ostrea edulis]|uniref:uncharacterized protein LOC125662212 isoform X4 n=1 Tax=Ostrea edulis TaxID=37623 RepID=UPI0024AEB95A|nr:uncharacterized protein LOC125662212 isoform X4 [Ostrea edulis]